MDLEQTFHLLLYRAFHAQRYHLRQNLAPLGLGSGQPKLLAYLAAKGPCHQRELAAYYEVDPAAVSRMLEALERNGFVTRQPDQASRRRDLVEITDKGRRAHEQWEARCGELEQVMLSDFTAQERSQFFDYLTRARRNLRDFEEGRK